MRKFVWLGLLAVPIILALTLPVSVVLPLFDPPDALDRVRGTVWSGNAQWRQPGQVPLALRWSWSGGRRWTWRAENGRTRLEGEWRLGAGGAVEAVSGILDLERVDLDHWLYATRPVGYLDLAIDRARLRSGQVPRIEGRAIWEEAGLEGSVHERLGLVEIEFEPGDAGRDDNSDDSGDASGDKRQRARIQSLDPAPVQVRGTIEADARTYWIDLWLRAAGDRPDLARQIGALGERQADGQVRLRFQGALGLSEDPAGN
ncbi:MAG: type II secretion system protein N [Wenzhouxiangella sp.]|jgi:hypothetical protein|nr:type II secretion system protein N [Wenzhouxiangella sp.]